MKPVRFLTRRTVDPTGATDGSDDGWSPPVAPIPPEGPLTLKQAARAWAASQYPQLAFDDPNAANATATVPRNAAPPMQPAMQPPWRTSPNVPGDIGGWMTGLAGADPQAPDQPARSPLEDWLDQYIRQTLGAR